MRTYGPLAGHCGAAGDEKVSLKGKVANYGSYD